MIIALSLIVSFCSIAYIGLCVGQLLRMRRMRIWSDAMMEEWRRKGLLKEE